MNLILKGKLAKLPTRPGVYLFRDQAGSVLYVGKAINLRNRVRSYFQTRNDRTPEKDQLVGQIADLETILTHSEVEALLLEANLIRRYQPPHNIFLRDEQSYLYVKIKLDEVYPRVELVRQVLKDRSRYFGPYTSAQSVRSTLRLLRKTFPYRTCLNPPERPCFDAQLKLCAGHDLARTSRKDYQEIIQGLIRFLSGHGEAVVRELKQQMAEASSQHQFERAALFRDRLQAVNKVLARQTVVATDRDDSDIIGLGRLEDKAIVNLFRVRAGKVIDRELFRLGHTAGVPDKELLAQFLEQYYAKTPDHPRDVLLPFYPSNKQSLARAYQLEWRVPVRGKKRRLVRLAETNARSVLLSTQASQAETAQKMKRALAELTAALRLAKPPQRIEAYDISNIQGVNPVGSMVVLQNGQPIKADYRKFAIKTVKGSNDFKMMAEMVRRRLQHSDWSQPDLIVLDGGLGQLSAVQKTVKSSIPMIALAKREELIYRLGYARPLRLKRNLEALFMLQRLRDEAHRFAVGYFRQKHEKGTLRSILDDVPGLGPKLRKLIKTKYGSIQALQNASHEELAKLIGTKRAEKLLAALR